MLSLKVAIVSFAFVIVLTMADSTAAPECAPDQCLVPDNCKNGLFTPPGQCCPKCKGEVKCQKEHKNEFGICISNCEVNSDCETGKICCKNPCGGKVCEEPVNGGNN